MEEAIGAILRMKNIAVVGLSRDEAKDSHRVASYLQAHGYRIIPINPNAAGEKILGEKVYASVSDVPSDVAIDVVDIFRPSADIPPIVDEAIARKAKAVWMQLGIAHSGAAEKAEKNGLLVVMDRCMKIEHSRRNGQV